MTDTGQVPAEGLPENAGMVEQPSVPAHGAYTYLSETTAEDEDLLLLPGAQGAWGNEVPPPAPEPVVETVQEPAPAPLEPAPLESAAYEPGLHEPGLHESALHGQVSQESAPNGQAPIGQLSHESVLHEQGAHASGLHEQGAQESVLYGQGSYESGPHETAPHGQGAHDSAPHEPGPHETAGRDSGSVDLGAVRLAEPPPAPVTPRRPLHLGPPLPDTSASPVRSLADRGPAGAPVRQSGPPTTSPEYLDAPQLRDLPPQGAAPWGAHSSVAAGVRTAETVAPAQAPAAEPAPEPADAAQAAVARLATEAVNGGVATAVDTALTPASEPGPGLAQAPDAGEAWQGHGQLYAVETATATSAAESSASSASSVHASTESSEPVGVPEVGQLPEGAEGLGAEQFQDGASASVAGVDPDAILVQDSNPVSEAAQTPEGAFVVSPTPEAVAAAEPGHAQEDQALDEAGEVQVQDAGTTPPVPTAVETPLTPEPLAPASDTEQPAPAADDSAPLAEAHPDPAVTPFEEAVPTPVVEESPVVLDATPGDPAVQPTAAPEAVPDQQFVAEAEPALAPQPTTAETHEAEAVDLHAPLSAEQPPVAEPLAQPVTPEAEFVESAEEPQAAPAGPNPDDSLGRFVPVEGSVPTTPHLAPTPPHPLTLPTEDPSGGAEAFAAVPGPREADGDGEPELVQHADDLDTRAADQEEESTAAVEEVRESTGPAAPAYDDAEREAVLKVMRERRDIRNGFRSDPIPHDVLLRVLEAAHTAPSVGHSQPWDFVVIRSADTRRNMHELAQSQREAYAKSLPKGRAKQFKELKIEAILDTPVNIVVTADPTRGGRHTLGRHTQPQMAPYSAALAVENLWLAARAEGLGVGWVSFFDEREMVRALGLPEHLEVIAYLCVGYVDEFPEEPELMQAGWSKRRPLSWVVHEETYGRRALPGEDPHDLLAETVAGIRPLDAKALGEAWERQKRMTKPPGSLGMLEIISAQLSGLSRQCPPPIPEPAAVAIFAGDHGVHAQGVTPWPQEVTAQMVANFLGGGAVCNAFASQVGAEVCVVDVGVASELPATPGLLPRKVRAGTSDMTTGPAMSREEAKQAIEVGIETARDLVAAGNRALLTGEMGIANTTASAALISVFTDTDPADVTGRGTGINDETLARKTEVVRRAIELHQPDPADPIGVLAAIGGFEHAAMVGLLLGGASLRTPVILDGVSAGAAALVARAIAPEVLAACIAGHRSAEPGHVAALNKLGLRPLVDLDLRLGEGTGALLALPLVQSTARAMHEVATFDSAGVTEK
ncbi:nicotinate-nucleotide--dimethylbenzimidazole phosphoribosyltransferase [Streptomyces hokutonensis]|uniref:nicotinate-nucleotide--dimethylbenzimidazole phosphoribosyltransferase n=1 Tax=Streptomyces hokutonensis TaxID=1306990 RepID=UPI00037ABFA2|nr:nicotinate-nucleotide--dimethylbenzimidazole phosphoribosyltransferase [Streptomyces hokutonensis]